MALIETNEEKLKILKNMPKELQNKILQFGQRQEEIAMPEPIQAENEREAVPWPDDFEKEAYHGLAGEVVEAFEPYTEADNAAILMTFLTAFGNMIGRSAYTRVCADTHGANLFTLIIGDSAKARKGTSLGPIRELFKRIDEAWIKERWAGGLTSGEGLIYHVRDPIWGKEKDRKTGEIHETIVDEGVKDKRLMIIESEFAAVLKIMQREGNTLSPVLRQAWDGVKLQGLQKNNPARATEPHISIIGHITAEELRRFLRDIDLFNGFSNRFLWTCVRRSKLLPDGAEIPEDVYIKLALKIREVIRWLESLKPAEKNFKRSKEAEETWKIAYFYLNSEHADGIVGAVTSRAEAQVLRLSLIYAVLDKSNTIKPEHIRAALAIWNRCQQSAEYFFGEESMEDPIQNAILEGLKQGPMTQTEISVNIFKRNIDATKIKEALEKLSARNRIKCVLDDSGSGRPKKIWSLM